MLKRCSFGIILCYRGSVIHAPGSRDGNWYQHRRWILRQGLVTLRTPYADLRLGRITSGGCLEYCGLHDKLSKSSSKIVLGYNFIGKMFLFFRSWQPFLASNSRWTLLLVNKKDTVPAAKPSLIKGMQVWERCVNRADRFACTMYDIPVKIPTWLRYAIFSLVCILWLYTFLLFSATC